MHVDIAHLEYPIEGAIMETNYIKIVIDLNCKLHRLKSGETYFSFYFLTSIYLEHLSLYCYFLICVLIKVTIFNLLF